MAKLKLALYWAASCGGCEIAQLEIGDKILKGQPLCSTIVVGNSKIEAFKEAICDRDLITQVLSLKNRLKENSLFLTR